MLEEFAKGSTILIDKPYEWTSFDVVNKIRWHLRKKLGVKRLKVGHAGTLDPLATGLLVVCIGKHTKRIEELMAGSKTYTGTILLGKTTPSYDLETSFNSSVAVDDLKNEDIFEAVKSFIGVQQQFPPVFSAKKIEGKRAYDLARAGKDVELKSNTIEIADFRINCERFPELDFELTCSKGTYIRSVAHDLGQKLGVGGTLINLRRVQSGQQHINEAKSVEEWIEFIQSTPL